MANRIADPTEAVSIARDPNSTPEEVQEAMDWLTSRKTSAEKAVAAAQAALDTEQSRLDEFNDAITEATYEPPVVHYITQISAPAMSTIWTFTAKSTDGKTVVFHADHRPARHICEELAAQAENEAEVEIPREFPRAALVTAMDIELIPDDCMGMSMPSVNPLGLNAERLNSLIAKFNGEK